MELNTKETIVSATGDAGMRAFATGTLAMGVGLFASKIFSFLREILIASFYGASPQTDALFVAMQAPMQLDSLVASTAVYSALMPPVVDLLQRENQPGVARLVNNASTLILLVSGTLSVLVMLGASLAVHLLAGGFAADIKALTARLLLITILAAPLMGLSNVPWAVLNGMNRFLLPSLSLSLGAIAVIVMTLLFGHTYGVYAPAVGVLIGMFLQVLIQYQALGRLGITYRPLLNLRDPDMQRALKLFFPLWLSGIFVVLSPYVNNLIASYLSEGSISALRYAYNLIIPIMTGVMAVSLAAFPKLTTLVVQGEYTKLTEALLKISMFLSFLLIGVSAWIILMRYQLVSIILQRGMFNAESTIRTAQALGAFALGLPFAGLYYYLIRGLFALSKNRTFLVISIISLVIQVILNLILVRWFDFVGIALSSAIVQLTTAALGSFMLHRYLQNKKFLSNIWRPIFIYSVAAAISYTGANFAHMWLLSLKVDFWAHIFTVSAILAALYISLAWLLELRHQGTTALLKQFWKGV